MPGVNGLLGLNVHTIALQVPITELAKSGIKPVDQSSPNSVIGVWASTFRTRGRLFDSTTYTYKGFGNNVQVSRLGNPLFNEVINPMARKDEWNGKPPNTDSGFATYVDHPELAGLFVALYPGVFPNLDAYNKSGKARADLDAILLTGIPATVFSKNPTPATLSTYTGSVKADMLRLNLATPPTAKGKENVLGVVYGDNAGFPNGRRVINDVTTIELRAIAGLTIPLVDTYTPDDIVKPPSDKLRDGSDAKSNPKNQNLPLLDHFPYLATPSNGYDTTPPVPSVTRADAP